MVLVALGTIWGLTVPLSRIAVSTGHQPLGLILWQLAAAVVVLGAVRIWRRQSLLPRRAGLGLFVGIAVLGTLLPNSVSYRAAVELPGGVLAIIIAMVPMFTLPIALLLRLEKLNVARFAGVVLGAIAIILLAAPEGSLPEAGKAIWVLFALGSPLFYALEANFLSWRGSAGYDAMDIIYGASLVGLVLVMPLALANDQVIPIWSVFGVPEIALTISALGHLVAYVGYVWLVGYAGSVFAAQVAYLVTGTGVLWSMVLLKEQYSLWVWAALAVIMVAVTLVRPRTSNAS